MPPEHTVISLDFKTANFIGQNALRILEEMGKEANIVVMDNRRNPLVYLMMDKPKDYTRGLAYKKADQSAATGKRTSTMNELVRTEQMTPGHFGFGDQELVPFGGGVPIYDDEGNQPRSHRHQRAG